jgi:uncharacterized protein YdcH (DUF465 family)
MNVAEVSEETVRTKLRTEDPEFEQLEKEHRKLDRELLDFETHVYLSPEEEFERRRLQKLKLAAKDRMMDMIRRYRMGTA